MPKVTNIFTGFSTVCGDTMAEKKDPGKFTVRFNICDPQHKAVVDLLNQQGRSKAQFLTNAVLHYINCTEAPELHIPTVPDKKFLEEQILAILAEHSWHVEKNTVELQIQANHDAASVQGIVERGGRIRRLMPRECLRLQGFDDEQIDKILAINSDAQAYKQAGNSVTVTVIEAIGRRIRAVDEALRKEAAA